MGLTIKSKLNLINYFKEEGNNNFKQKEYHQCLEYYQNCLLFLDSIHFDQNDDEKHNNNNIDIITSTILSNLSQTHLHLYTANPDLYTHLLAALNCAQISLHCNPNNAKSITRRIIALYRLGMHQFAEQIIKNTNPTDINPSICLI